MITTLKVQVGFAALSCLVGIAAGASNVGTPDLDESGLTSPTEKRVAVVGFKPDALLSVALNRTSVIDGIVEKWSGEIANPQVGLSREQFIALLKSLRADHLLAASLAQSRSGLLDILTASTSRDASAGLGNAKALGSSTQDLVFTPLAPCRLVDTRGGAPWTPNIPRSYNGYTATDFSSQGGASSNCGIPSGASALAIEAIALFPPADGWFYLWPGNIAQPPSSTFNYGPAMSALAFGTILPVDGANSNQFKANSSQATHLIVDVVGYFAPPATPSAQHSMSYGPVDFIMAKNDGTALTCLLGNHNCSFPNGNTTIRFTLKIPGPSVLTDLSCLVLDNDAGNITMELWNSSVVVGTATTNVNNSQSQVLALTGLNFAVGAGARGPMVRMTFAQTSTTMFLYECHALYNESAY